MPASIKDIVDYFGFYSTSSLSCSDDCIGKGGMFYVLNADINTDKLEPLFRHNVLSMLKRKGLIRDRVNKLFQFQDLLT